MPVMQINKEYKRVSVVMCTYNGEKYLRQQLDSIVNQSYPIYELLIQDDASTDSTLKILQAYQDRFSYIKVIRNTRNVGIAQNFKSVFYKAKGNFIAVADQDDIWMPTKIACMMEAIGDNLFITSASYLLSQGYEESMLDSIVCQIPVRQYQEQRYVSLQATLSGHDMLFRTELLSYIPDLFWKSFWYDFCLAIVAIGLKKAVYLNRYLTLWRRHEGAYSYAKENRGKYSLFVDLFSPFWDTYQRNKIRRFYDLLLPILKQNEIAFQFARYMSEGKLFKASFYTLCHRNLFVDVSTVGGFRSFLRAFLIPWLTSRNIKNWNAMYLGDK